MIDKVEKTVIDNKAESLFCKTPGLDNLETYVLLDYRFNTFMVLIFSEKNKPQIYKTPYRDSPHHEIEILLSFEFLNLCQSDGHTEDYYIRQPNDKNFPFQIENQKYIIVGNKVFNFETSDKILKYSSKIGYNDVKYPYAYGKEDIYLMLHKNCITFAECEKSTPKGEYQCL